MLFETPEQMWKRIMFVYENLKLMHSLQRLDSMPGMMIQCLDRRLITTAILSSYTARGSFRHLLLGPGNRVAEQRSFHLMQNAFRIL